MPLSDDVRKLTIERGTADEIRAVALDQGMRSLRDDGFEKVKNGITSIAEIARVT
jgi:type IV pilus assembly protein PilB